MIPAFKFALFGLDGFGLAFAVAILGFCLWMLVDCSLHEKGSTKMIWMLIMLFAAPAGSFVYLLLRKLSRVTRS